MNWGSEVVVAEVEVVVAKVEEVDKRRQFPGPRYEL